MQHVVIKSGLISLQSFQMLRSLLCGLGTRCIPLGVSVCSYECMSVTVQGQQGALFLRICSPIYFLNKISHTAGDCDFINIIWPVSPKNLPSPYPITRIASMYHHALCLTWMLGSSLGTFGWMQTFDKRGGCHLPSLSYLRSGRLSTWVFLVPF